MRVSSLDHLVLTVQDIEASVRFYEALGMRRETFGDPPSVRTAVCFGEQKLNLHPAGAEIAPHAARPVPGSADLCFLVDDDPDDIAGALAEVGIPIELGPAPRTGATGPLQSVYVRDPDGNLVELSRRRGQ